ncbi:Nucleolar_GTP-binding protein 1 [Hexamita inflata]|uniref:Nucleolar GTP-binding protein 1 n=1 Tax=Hexamita inflata TaxID=28002 RepID=A0AA86RGX6_9EUKA|nr:Nucleolar GTP-binding protein 1 [Hexamita inflata]
MPVYDFKSIAAVQGSKDLIDTILYKTTRKTPTVVRKGFKINRIRSFYMLKVKYTQNTIDAKFQTILGEFPKLDDIHPFYRYWFNIMYDKDHFKVALGQLNQCKALVDKVGKHYLKLLKHADSLFQCKSLKVAALGRMVSLVRKMNPYLEFLEQVRQHMGRLPAIDPSTRTVVLTGYPSTGKSSYLNALTRANVDVQAWAFTTQSLLIGHAEHRGMNFQVIDTPGLLDHAPEERNTIELQAITALAYLNSAIVFVLDVTQGKAFIEKQIELYHNLKPFFNNKPVTIVLSKIDTWNPSELSQYELDLVQSLSPNFLLKDSFDLASIPYPTRENVLEAQNTGGEAAIQMIQAVKNEQAVRDQVIQRGCSPFLCVSAKTTAGIERSLGIVCDQLLLIRQAQSQSAQKAQEITGKGTAAIPGLFVAQPMARDNKNRPALIPQSVQQLNDNLLHPRPFGEKDGFVTEKMREDEAGGCTNYAPDPRRLWILENEEERYDEIPLIHNGKNILDFITAEEDITKLIEELEKEEEMIAQQKPTIDDAELFARLAAFEKAVVHTPKKNRRTTKIKQRHDERKIIFDAPKVEKEVLHENDVNKAANMTWEQKMLEEVKHSAPIDVVKKEFNKKRRDGQRAFKFLESAVSAPKHMMTGHMSMKTRDWR